jgi:hypothetical protein
MNSPTVLASITATLFAALALASTQAMAAKPVGGGSTDCSTAVDFPAFAFWRPAGKSIEILVADATGKCVRSVIKTTGIGGTIQFSYPVGDSSNRRGRIAWVAAPAVVSVDFTSDALTKQVTVFGRKTIYSGTGGFISLSKDGSELYSTRYPGSGGPVVDRVLLDATGSATETTPGVLQAPPGSNLQTISVSGKGIGTVLFADYKPIAGAATNQLVWILLDSPRFDNVIDADSLGREFTPAADTEPSSNRVVAYTKFVGGCDALFTSDLNVGVPVSPDPDQAAYGLKPTWVNGNIVADGRTAACDYSGTIMQTNPNTGEQVALTRGYDPDGK